MFLTFKSNIKPEDQDSEAATHSLSQDTPAEASLLQSSVSQSSILIKKEHEHTPEIVSEQRSMKDPLNGDDHYGPRGRNAPKSRDGCLTCKIRRKKCDYTKPVCKDCLRFNKDCVWPDFNTMTTEEIRDLKEKVRAKESTQKMRRRRRLDQQKAKSQADSFASNAYETVQRMDTLPASHAEESQPPVSPKTSQQHYISALQTAYAPAAAKNGHGSASHNPIHGSPLLADSGDIPVVSTDALSAFTLPLSGQDLRNQPLLPPFFSNIVKAVNETGSPPPLDLEFYKDIHTPSASSPDAFLSYLKELSSSHRADNKLTLLEDEDTQHHESVRDLSRNLSFDFKAFNIPEFFEQFHNLGSGQSDLISKLNAALSPSPSPPMSTLPGMDPLAHYLYNYYVDTLSRKVSIAPNSQNESNSYQIVFLPAAEKDMGVLYGILAWAGFHLGGQWLNEGSKYAEMAVKHLTKDVDFNVSSTITNDRRAIINKLATILILCGAEICRGDVRYWSVYLNWGWKLLRDNGGILNFDTNKEEHWLISNFAYHDLLASSTTERGTYFPISTYQRIFTDPEGISKGNLNPLLGISKSLFKVIGDINELFYESKMTLHDYYNRTPLPRSSTSQGNIGVEKSPEEAKAVIDEDDESELSRHGETSKLLLSIIDRAKHLERTIDEAKPDLDDLKDLSDDEIELQLTSFEAFQLSCKLYLRQSIMRCNPSSLESQVLVNDLVKCIDILLSTPMQATLVFPIFMAGIHTVTDMDKESMRARVEKMIEMYGPWNVVRVKTLIEEVWIRNENGDRVVDWNLILKELGWELNFA